MTLCVTLGGQELRVPQGAVVGLIGNDPGSCGPVLDAARQAGATIVDRPFLSPVERLRLTVRVEELRRRGETLVLLTADESLLRACDEVWWIEQGMLRARAHPAEVLPLWARAGVEEFRRVSPAVQPLPPLFRRGDGRAELLSITPRDSEGQPAALWHSGQPASCSVRVQFRAEVADPVVGLMIRNKLGMEVYGTNTELENLRFGPVAAGQVYQVDFSFLCRLCPQLYVITAASHDPDGLWHDWMEDAVAVTVAGSRYTAGVADLAATVTVTPA